MATLTKKPRNLKDSSRPIYYKTFVVKDLKVDEDSRRISGYAAVWGNKDDADDILIKGCCAKSIAERGPGSDTPRKIIYLWMHEHAEPLGSIVTLKEDDIGLYFEAETDKIPLGDRSLTQLKSGTLNQFSIGYMYVWDKLEYDEAQAAFIVKEINLFEISVVSLGCNEMTQFTGMKTVELESERNKLLRDTEKALKSLPYDTQLQLKQLIAKHISLAEAEPLDALKEDLKPKKAKKSIDYKSLSQALKN